MSDLVKIDIEGPLLIATIDNPPVNALGVDVRSGLIAALDAATANDSVQAVLIVSAGKLFSAGADIREFAAVAKQPTLPELCNRVELSKKPVVIAVHGDTLGAALELALSAHYRLALRETKVGFPEVNLGLLPGAGGTQRAPRLAGIKAALDMVLSGRPVGAQDALAMGLLDVVDDGTDTRAAGLAYANQLVKQHATVRPTRERTHAQADAAQDQAALAAVRADILKKSPATGARMRIVDVIAATLDRPFEESLAFERENFLACRESDEHKGLVHAFTSERAVADTPESKKHAPRSIASVGVVGGGTMGVGIAIAMLDAGLQVTTVERDEESAARARERVAKNYADMVAKARIDDAARVRTLERYAVATNYESLAQADLVVEAVFEDMAVKKEVFRALDKICKPGAVLATNTSYLDINEIARATGRPADVIGLHFFSPANIMKLVEVVVAEKTGPEVVSTAFALTKKLRKTAVRSGVCDGFIGNRVMNVYRTAADYLMEDGASPYQIDKALRDFGFAMGPYQVADLAGGDIGWANRKRRAATRDPAARYVQIADRICEKGWLGQKTGRGYYLYEAGTRRASTDPEVLALIDAERERAGISPKTFSDDEIRRRYMAAMINEGANVVNEGIARRPMDVDVVFLAGYGFPRFRGGPMKYADTVGPARVLADIQEFAKEDALFWKPSPLLVELTAKGGTFGELNAPVRR